MFVIKVVIFLALYWAGAYGITKYANKPMDPFYLMTAQFVCVLLWLLLSIVT